MKIIKILATCAVPLALLLICFGLVPRQRNHDQVSNTALNEAASLATRMRLSDPDFEKRLKAGEVVTYTKSFAKANSGNDAQALKDLFEVKGGIQSLKFLLVENDICVVCVGDNSSAVLFPNGAIVRCP